MNTKSMDLVWVTANNLKDTVKFYTDTVGLKLKELNEQYGWAELEGPAGGARLGVAQKQPDSKCSTEADMKNAVMTFTVVSLDKAISDMTAKGAKMIGETQEVPGHVKLQMVQDVDGNCFQLVEVLAHHCAHC